MEKFNSGMVVHVYNPSHDEALAMNKTQYCPSSAARRTGELFWDVAKWWMAPDDFILRLPTDGSLQGVDVPDWTRVTAVEPWGWDRHIVGVLRKLGAPDRLLPSEVQLDRIRELSSRRTSVLVLERLATLPFVSRWCTDEAAVRAAIADYGGRAVLKQPWSCSGRGVWRSDSQSSEQRVRKTLREQGAVEVEPVYERLADFAMEFFSEGGSAGVHYEGLSFFETHDGGGYKGNVVAVQKELQRRLEAFAPASLLNHEGHLPLKYLEERLCEALSVVLTDYRGPLGVDMMLTPEGIHPCIEVNLRNTMGRVAIFEARAACAIPRCR